MAENTRNKDRQRQQNTGDRPQADPGQDRQRQGAGQPAPSEPDELSDLSQGVTDDEELEEERITQRTPRQHDEIETPKR